MPAGVATVAVVLVPAADQQSRVVGRAAVEIRLSKSQNRSPSEERSDMTGSVTKANEVCRLNGSFGSSSDTSYPVDSTTCRALTVPPPAMTRARRPEFRSDYLGSFEHRRPADGPSRGRKS